MLFLIETLFGYLNEDDIKQLTERILSETKGKDHDSQSQMKMEMMMEEP